MILIFFLDPNYKLNINGSMNVTDIYIKGEHINNTFILRSDVEKEFVTISDAQDKYNYLVKDSTLLIKNIYFTGLLRDYQLVLGISTTEPGTTTINNPILKAYGFIDATKFLIPSLSLMSTSQCLNPFNSLIKRS